MLVLACKGPADSDSGPIDTDLPDTDRADTDETDLPDTDPVDTDDTDTDVPLDPHRVAYILHGGGSEDDALYTEMVAAAHGGPVVTLGANDLDDPYLLFWDTYWTGLGASSAATINTLTPADVAGADLDLIDGAALIYVRGGDQSEYLRLWKGTPLHDALLRARDRGAVISGSSAGCALLGDRVYDARVDSVGAYEALLDPYDSAITFEDDWLDAIPHVLPDTHFTERGRIGRLLVFLARWQEDGEGEPLGIGVDPRTALFVRADGTAYVQGDGSVTLLDGTHMTIDSMVPGEPPSIRGVQFWQLPAGYEIDLVTRTVLERPDYAIPVTPAAVDGGVVTIDGSANADRRLGEWFIGGLDADAYGWQDRGLTLEAGSDVLGGSIVVTRLYDDSDYFENHVGGLVWGLAQTQGLGFAVDENMQVELDHGVVTPAADSYLLVIDARYADHAGVPETGWQTAAIEAADIAVFGP